MNYSIIPSEKDFEKTMELARSYNTGFEYNDFYKPEVYENEAEIRRLTAFYSAQPRDRSRDTLHGAFLGLDISAADTVLRERSRALFRRSMQTARELGVRGVVFHTGLAGGLARSFADNWLREAEPFLRELCAEFSELELYLENTAEQEPYIFSETAKALCDVPNFGLCLDYAHAALTKTPAEMWFKELAPNIRHIHINDNDLESDLHLAVGDGKINYAEFMYLVRKYGMEASVLIETDTDKAERSLKYLSGITPHGSAHSKQSKLEKILDIGIALTTQRDPGKLLNMIVDTAMSLTNSDGGTLYILEDDQLKFRIMKTRSKGVDLGGDGSRPDMPSVPLRRDHICACCAMTKKVLNIPDVYNCSDFDFSGPRDYDKLNGYRTRSMAAIPLINYEDEVMGVLQLINAQENGSIREYSAEDVRVVWALGSQAASALSNVNYLKELKEQMWSFTEAMTEAIDARTPYNASHTKKVAQYSVMLAKHINKLHEQGRETEFFDPDRLEQLEMAAYVHDIGKLAVPSSVMDKPTRLSGGLAPLMSRLKEISLKARIALLEGEISEEYFKLISERVADCEALVKKFNDPINFIDDNALEKLHEIFEYSFVSPNETIAFFAEKEKEMLSIRRGTLTKEERGIMESHVKITEEILSKVHWGTRYENVKDWAARHHELLNGKGYPRGLREDELPLEVRILTVADICDALLADDRPYKKAKTLEQTLDILHNMANNGEIEARLVEYLEECLRGTP